MPLAKTILVVDDDRALVRYFDEFFKTEGYDFYITTDPEKALKFSESIKPQLLVLDIKMPKFDGFELLEKIRKRDPGVEVIIVTAFANEYKSKIEKAKVYGVIPKPPDILALDNMILKALKSEKVTVREKKLSGSDRLSVLVVDDEDEIVDFMQSVLSDRGFKRVDGVRSGEEGLEKAKERQYDLCILDIRMGFMSGLDMAKEMLKLSYPPKKFMVLSANWHEDDTAPQFKELGITDYIEKPIQLDKMIQKVEELMTKLKA